MYKGRKKTDVGRQYFLRFVLDMITKRCYNLIKKKSLLEVSGINENSKKYCFIVDINFEPVCASNIAVVDEMKSYGVDFSFICNDTNDNIVNYKILSSDGKYYSWNPDFSGIVIDKVIDGETDVISYNYETGLFGNVSFKCQITYDWYKAANGKYTDEEIKTANALAQLLTNKESQLIRYQKNKELPTNQKIHNDKGFLKELTAGERANILQSEYSCVQAKSIEDKFWEVVNPIGKAYINSNLNGLTWSDFLKNQIELLR